MKRPFTLKLTAILMLILALMMIGIAAARQFGLIGGDLEERISQAAGRRNPGAIQPTLQPPADSQTSQDGSGVTRPRRILRQGGRILGLFGNVMNWVDITLGALGLLTAYLLWKPSRWGIILTVILSLLILITSIPNLWLLRLASAFPVFRQSILFAFVRILLILVALVLALLPASRAATARVSNLPKERVVL